MPEPEPISTTKCVDIFLTCQSAILGGALIQRVSRQDKEFHFQNWFEERLKEANVHYDQKGRNSYPDFTLVQTSEGYEVKGLAWPGREVDYDRLSLEIILRREKSILLWCTELKEQMSRRFL